MNNNIKACQNCGFELTTINYSAKTTEQWVLNNATWECAAKHSLTDDPEQNVFCPECDEIVGTGKDFGF